MRWLTAPVWLGLCLAFAGASEQKMPIRSIQGHFELVPQVLGGSTDSDSAARARSAFLLGQIGSRRCTRALLPMLDDPSRAVRYQAGIALCALGDERGLAAAGAALASAAEWIRYYAVSAIAGLATERARQTLRSLRPDQPPLITEHLDEALKQWPWPSAPPLRAAQPMGPYGTLEDLMVDAGGVFVVESDVYWHKGQYPQCVRCNETVTFLDPAYVEMYGNSAWLLWSMGLNRRALAVVWQGVQANQHSWSAWFNLGYQCMLMHDYTKAARFLKRSVELGAPAVNYRQYCHALEKSGRPDLALKEWQGLLETHPDDPIAPRQISRLQRVLRGEEPPEKPGPGGDSVRRPGQAC
jgi:hypothetical protein